MEVIGSRVGVDDVEYIEVATHAAVVAVMASGGVDLVILDGEARPAGGLGVARQLTDELRHCPPLLVLIARSADAWLAAWSRADATLGPGYTPQELMDSVIRLCGQRTPVTSRSALSPQAGL